MNRSRTPGAVVPLLLFVLAGTALSLAAGFAHTLFLAPAGAGSAAVEVEITPGADLDAIAATLAASGVLTGKLPFLLAARLRGRDRSLKAGHYVLSPAMNPAALVEALSAGTGHLVRVTIPEGYRLEDAARRLEEAGVTGADGFLTAARDRDLLDGLGVPGPTAEGFLFPETYFFSPGSPPETVMKAMVSHFRGVFSELRAAALPSSLTLLEAVTLASLVEKESGRPDERPLVAAVFLNRLRIGYPLQCDSSVIYGITDFSGNLTRRDLKTPGPYNTYLNRGLPPGPIANPGREALRAVLEPAPVDYLYFVSRNDGTHQFSSSLREHNRAVRRYQLAGRRP